MVIFFFFFFLMACQGTERKKEKIKTEMIPVINKNYEYTTSLFIIYVNFKKKNGKKYFYLKTISITP